MQQDQTEISTDLEIMTQVPYLLSNIIDDNSSKVKYNEINYLTEFAAILSIFSVLNVLFWLANPTSAEPWPSVSLNSFHKI